MSKTYVIAEIGINHQGSLDTALKLVDAAAAAGVDAVKFQKRNLKEIYTKKLLEDSNSAEWNFDYLLPILKETEFEWQEYQELKLKCDDLGLHFIITPFDPKSAEFCEILNPFAFKVSSADMVNHTLLKKLMLYGRPLILSTGMWEKSDIQATVDFFKNYNFTDYSLLLCNSTYPAPYENIPLKFLNDLKEMSNTKVGYSGHERGIFIPVAAVAMGATIIEKHITFDRNQKGPDHKASLLPDEFKQMVSNIRDLEKTLHNNKTVNQAETLNKEVFAKSAVVTRDLKIGEKIQSNDIIFKSPGKGIFEHKLYKYIGETLKRPIKLDDYLTKDHFNDAITFENWQQFDFQKRWGVKCRFNDFEKHKTLNSPVIEFHCSQGDIERETFTGTAPNSELIVHAPEIVNRMLVDFCSTNQQVVRESIDLIQKTIDRTIEINKGWKSDRPKMVIHVGGMSSVNQDENGQYDTEVLTSIAIDNFSKLKWNPDDIEILPENLPPRPWYFGGEWHQYGFAQAKDFLNFCDYFNFGMTYDLCHAQLYCNLVGIDQADYAEQIKPLVRHLHISDASGINGEGIQIGDGMVNFEPILSAIKDVDFTWVTEIWSGHLHEGQGMYKGLQLLNEKYSELL